MPEVNKELQALAEKKQRTLKNELKNTESYVKMQINRLRSITEIKSSILVRLARLRFGESRA
jgi:hypothetical protein